MSGLDIATSIFKALNVPSVLDLLVGGSVYKFNRPINSPNRDIVISLPDESHVDINIHVPNLITHDDQTNPDLIAFKSITDEVLSIIGGINNTGIPTRDKDGSWYVNINLPLVGNVQNVSLFVLSSTGDGYGGSLVSSALIWSGTGYKIDVTKGNQMSLEAGRYELNMKCSWVLPESANPTKYMLLVAEDGDYVINGIIPQWIVSTSRKDGDY